MGARDAKQFVFRYNGVENSEEVEEDLDGEMPVPQKDQLVERGGKSWRVLAVNVEHSLSRSGPIPVVRVFLSDQIA